MLCSAAIVAENPTCGDDVEAIKTKGPQRWIKSSRSNRSAMHVEASHAIGWRRPQARFDWLGPRGGVKGCQSRPRNAASARRSLYAATIS
ncbi:hypothetical protein ACOMHN_057169 [Nucella lapillus]